MPVNRLGDDPAKIINYANTNKIQVMSVGQESRMPIVTITVRKPKTSEFKNAVLDAAAAALVGAGVNPNDRFHRVIELDPDDFRFDPTFPDLSRPRTDDFVLIELLIGTGRSVKIKKKIVADIIETLSGKGFDGEHVMIVFGDVAWENWSPGGGRIPHA
jgi:phenylpyruvate tautomerase PptA (4-oxalocrotonate tautomerase family)